MRCQGRRAFLRSCGLAVAGGLLGATRTRAVKGTRPNVLFIAIDDLRPELGCYGARHIHSPNIDGLAAEGTLFESAYCQVPVCGPSRASLLTGTYPRNLEWTAEAFAPDATTLPEAFRKAGYRTVCNGKIFHKNDDTAERSWSEPPFSLVNGECNNKALTHVSFHDEASANFILEKNGRGPFFEAPDVDDSAYIDGLTCDKALADMRRLAEEDEPFFLGCGFVRPHLPFYAPKKYWDLYDRESIEIADNRYRPKNAPKELRGSGEMHSYHDRGIAYNADAFHRIARHGYYACVSYADALVGKLLKELDALGLRDDTIVLLWGDHGWNLGENDFWSKHNLLHTSANAPLIIRAPGFEKNTRTQGIVEFVDIFPTLCDLAGINAPAHIEGTSLTPLMRTPAREWKKAAFTRYGKGSAVFTRGLAYTEWDTGARMLYDRRKDPGENINVSEDPAYADTVSAMHRMLGEGWKGARP